MVNNLLGLPHGEGFAVDSGVWGHTKGIWINRDYQVLPAAAGGAVGGGGDAPQKVVSLFMDTEGFGAVGNDKSNDAKLCALAAVFSSNMLYNVDEMIMMGSACTHIPLACLPPGRVGVGALGGPVPAHAPAPAHALAPAPAPTREHDLLLSSPGTRLRARAG